MASAAATDFLIVGAGSAGCVLANRLSASGASVRVIEAGIDTPPGAVPEDVSDPYPRSYYNDAYMWPNLTADQGGDGSGTKSAFRQARVMGGGSSVMGMVAVRGRPEDYDGWAASGAEGWGWEDVLPYFRRLERDLDFGGALHGQDGPVLIRRHDVSDWPGFTRAIGQAAASRYGLGLVDDMNGSFQDGHCRLPVSASLTSRVSSASAYLDAAVRSRAGMRIECGVTALRLNWNGCRCTGASILAGGREEVRTAKHVIVAAGAIHSPALLQRSGVGASDALERLGVATVADLPGVGENLQNHPVVYLATHLRPAARQSPLLRPQFVSGLRVSSGENPDMRGDLLLLVMNKSSWHGLGHAVGGIGVTLVQPFSRGSVQLLSSAPNAEPDVRFRLLTDGRDLERVADGLAIALGLMEDEAVAAVRHELFVAGYSRIVRELNKPGLANVIVTQLLASLLDSSDAVRRVMIKYGIAQRDIDEARMRTHSWRLNTARRRAFGTYHPAGTCRIGPASDPMAVVDPSCRVHGVEGLSVVDASVMPTLVRGNTNIPVIMIAEHTADLIAASYR